MIKNISHFYIILLFGIIFLNIKLFDKFNLVSYMFTVHISQKNIRIENITCGYLRFNKKDQFLTSTQMIFLWDIINCANVFRK